VYFKKEGKYDCYYNGVLASDEVGKYMKVWVDKDGSDYGEYY